ncbi:hypothetical protein DERP_007911 [Dermatophagoides pteronyssinus]|uniref:Uncharacterized protein n=1 Tax=Dermatophagoides pteronyssinus TaxID=6956 RepID=A0ABQ8ISY5_DERPT|nr:hypothetical protein DERP_007911 [Dermatophagoides pteronyssinus]
MHASSNSRILKVFEYSSNRACAQDSLCSTVAIRLIFDKRPKQKRSDDDGSVKPSTTRQEIEKERKKESKETWKSVILSPSILIFVAIVLPISSKQIFPPVILSSPIKSPPPPPPSLTLLLSPPTPPQ